VCRTPHHSIQLQKDTSLSRSHGIIAFLPDLDRQYHANVTGVVQDNVGDQSYNDHDDDDDDDDNKSEQRAGERRATLHLFSSRRSVTFSVLLPRHTVHAVVFSVPAAPSFSLSHPLDVSVSLLTRHRFTRQSRVVL
jgi:hypothetical protein